MDILQKPSITNTKLTQIFILIHWISILGHVAVRANSNFIEILFSKESIIFYPGGGVSVAETGKLMFESITLTDVLFGI